VLYIEATRPPLIEGRPCRSRAGKPPDARSRCNDPAITLRVYAHVIRTAEAAAADIFAQAMKAS
jgi:hypothetical protein